jgi:chemotaxis response regulator CheB
MGASQAVSQVSVMPKSVIKQGKDHSVVGINKAYQTGTTAVTSHPDTFSVTQHNMSHHP